MKRNIDGTFYLSWWFSKRLFLEFPWHYRHLYVYFLNRKDKMYIYILYQLVPDMWGMVLHKIHEVDNYKAITIYLTNLWSTYFCVQDYAGIYLPFFLFSCNRYKILEVKVFRILKFWLFIGHSGLSTIILVPFLAMNNFSWEVVPRFSQACQLFPWLIQEAFETAVK